MQNPRDSSENQLPTFPLWQKNQIAWNIENKAVQLKFQIGQL